MEQYRKELEKYKRTRKISLYNFTTNRLTGIACELFDYELIKQGATIRGWKYFKTHKLSEEPCLYNGEKIASLNNGSSIAFLINKYPDLKDEYLEKIKNQIQNGTYDKDFMAEQFPINIFDKLGCFIKALFSKKK